MSDKIREEFEASNPIPEGVIRYGDGYILHTIGTLSPAFSFIKAGEFIAKFAGYVEGWKAALAQQPAPVAVPNGITLEPLELRNTLERAASALEGRMCPTACTSETSCCMPDVRDSARELRALLGEDGEA